MKNYNKNNYNSASTNMSTSIRKFSSYSNKKLPNNPKPFLPLLAIMCGTYFIFKKQKN